MSTGRSAPRYFPNRTLLFVYNLSGPGKRVNKPFLKKEAGLFLSVIMLTEIQELLHAAVYITSSSPDHTCLRMNLRDERDTCNFGKEREHILIEETAAAALLHEL